VTKTFKGRREDQRLITGQGRFTADWNLPGQLYGHFLRADRAHAEIVSLDAKAARAAPGVKAVLTGEDVRKAGFKEAPPLVKFPGRGGMKLLEPHRDVLAVGRVRHVGQEVALVVADSPAAAQDAAEKIEIEYRELPVLVEVDDALAPGALQLYDEIPGNLKVDMRARLQDKIMFGSDYPSMPYARILKEWQELGYSSAVMEKIFHKNAERILGL